MSKYSISHNVFKGHVLLRCEKAFLCGKGILRTLVSLFPRYGQHNMQFVSYNLRDVREKKGQPLDRVPIVENPLSDETGSVKTDISVHVPVFNEKLDGK